MTLSIHRFWLTTDVRRFLSGHTEIAGEKLEYIGTPLELFVGFLASIAIVTPVYANFFLAALDLGPLGQVPGLIGFGELFVLGRYAIYRARRASGELAASAIGLIGYMITALGYSTIDRATVMLPLWQLGMESLQLSGHSTFDTVRAGGRGFSPLGEGLADVLSMGGDRRGRRTLQRQ